MTRMHKKILLISVFPLGIAVALMHVFSRPIAIPETVEGGIAAVADGAPAMLETGTLAGTSEASGHHPVSLPAMMGRTYDGRDFRIDDTLARTDAYTRHAISYMSGSLRITGIMNLPHGEGPFPVLILNHGYIDPAVYTIGRGLKREQDYLARRGFVVVHPDYRNHAGSDDDPDYRLSLRLGYTEDVINAVLAVRGAGLPSVDASRIGMMGHSMGGGIAQNIAVVLPELVDAFVLYAPVSGDYRENFEKYTRRRTDEADAVIDAYGGYDDTPRFWSEVSPMHYYGRVDAPVEIHIGTADDSTPPEWSYAIRDRLEAEGKDVALHVYDGEPHEFIHQWPLMMSRIAEFFTRQLLN